VTDDRAPSWQTDAPGTFVTLRADGPLDGSVTITAIAGGHGRTLVGVSWTQDGHRRSDSLEVETYEHARELADFIAKELVEGTPPDLTRD
jgi:hypothetical protein